MIVIPAIDLKEGRCVRLVQGNFRKETVYADDPVHQSLIWKTQGAERLHVVDLDGSVAGVPRHADVISRIAAETGLPVQVGGGIREMKTVETYLKAGIRWVILGTAALRDPAFVRNACRTFPDRVIIGIDAREGRVAVQGWTETQAHTPSEVASRFAAEGPAALVYTDIARDGMETGVNVEGTRALAAATGIPVIASGGVAGIGDIEKLMKVEQEGVFAVIAGKALYTGALSLAEAIDRTRKGAAPIGAGRDRYTAEPARE